MILALFTSPTSAILDMILQNENRELSKNESDHLARRGPGRKYRSSTNRHIVTYELEGQSYNDVRALNRVRTRWCRDNCQANWTGAMRQIRFDSLEDASLFVMGFGGSLKVAT